MKEKKNRIKKDLFNGIVCKEGNRQTAGITLIALVVTIIVLLILAGVAIVTLTGENGILAKAQLAKERNQKAEQDEKDKLSSYEDELGKYSAWVRTGGDGTVTISEAEYNKLKRIGYTLLWTGTADKVGSKDSSGNDYKFINSTMDVDNYDFILIEFIEKNGQAKDSNMISKNMITKNHTYDIRLTSFNERETKIHFIDNGFVVDWLPTPDGEDAKICVRNIYGINF